MTTGINTNALLNKICLHPLV